jgi:hypothetical protein
MEPVIGRGMRSGDWYTLAENGPERVRNQSQQAAPGSRSSPVTVTLQAGAVQVYGAAGQDEESIANRVADKLSNVFTVAGRESGLSM